jgi:Ca2+/Na+ antiporter
MAETTNTPEKHKSEDVIADYYDGVKDLEIQGYETGIKKARTALFVVAGLTLVAELIAVNSSPYPLTPLVIGIIAIEVGIFIGLAFWTKSKPYTAILIGLIAYIALWILSIVINGTENAIRGILFKIIIIVYLIQALKPAKAWEDAKKNKI